MKITLPGIIPSKKNNQMILKTKTGRRFIAPSKAYKEWHRAALIQIRLQNPQFKTLTFVRKMTITVFFTDRRKQDTINKAEGVLDTLVDAGIIEDDNYIVLPDILLIGRYRKGEPGVEIEIE